MSISTHETDAERLTLPANLDVEHSAAIRELLVARIDDPAVSLDAAAVSRIHTAALQLLCVFWRDRAAAGRVTRWHQTSASLLGAADLLGLNRLLQLESVTP
jgi:ABC-type transporter Mla MlaB component